MTTVSGFTLPSTMYRSPGVYNDVSIEGDGLAIGMWVTVCPYPLNGSVYFEGEIHQIIAGGTIAFASVTVPGIYGSGALAKLAEIAKTGKLPMSSLEDLTVVVDPDNDPNTTNAGIALSYAIRIVGDA